MAIAVQQPTPIPGSRAGSGGDYPPGCTLPRLTPTKAA